MRVGDVLFFSPRFSFAKLDLDDPATLIDALQDRVEGYYLKPAARCLASGDTFAGGLVCCAAIDFLSLVCEDKRPSDWLNTHVPEFNKHAGVADEFWIHFRHGLMHEGYIKSQGQFSLHAPELLMNEGPAIVINPQLLVEAVDRAFREYSQDVHSRAGIEACETASSVFRRGDQGSATGFTISAGARPSRVTSA